jgi:uncharacterized protein YjbI with pentapeptide repeats
MANIKHLQELKLGTEAWNEWRKNNPIVKPDLSGAFLSQANLSKTDLTETDLSRSNLSRTDLSKANLSRASLNNSNLTNATPIEADLSEANLKDAKLVGVNLIGANLSGTNLSGVDLSEANLIGANLSRANLYGAILNGANLSGANLDHANLRKAQINPQTLLEEKWRLVHEILTNGGAGRNLAQLDLSKTYLVGANLKGVNLIGGNLQEADLLGADLSRAKLSRANLSRVDLRVAHLMDAELIGADLSKTNLSRACLSRANFSRASLSKGNLSRACLTKANFSRADLTGADLYGAELDEADFTKADFSRANLIKTQAFNTIFFGANFTAACLENWSINSQTILDGVICEYVYLKENQQERFPHKEEQTFAPGEFTKLFGKPLTTINLLFVDGIDWKAFLISYHKLILKMNGKEIFLQAIERKQGGNFLVKLETCSDEKATEIEEYFVQEYKVQLKAIEKKYRSRLNIRDEQLAFYRQHNADLIEIVKLKASQPLQNIIEIDWSDKNFPIANNNRQFISNTLGDNKNTRTQAVAEPIAEISVTLPPEQPKIEELLKKLSETLANEPSLDREDKIHIEEKLKALAKAGKNPQDQDTKKIVQRTIVILKGMVAGLPRTTKDEPKCDRLLFEIIEFFGLR